jgi:hypothetical protein
MDIELVIITVPENAFADLEGFLALGGDFEPIEIPDPDLN